MNLINYLRNFFEKRRAKKELKRNILSEANIDNGKTAEIIAQSMSQKCRQLYRKLAGQIHPDKFIDESKKNIATELFKKVENSQNNYGKLSELEIVINEFLQL